MLLAASPEPIVSAIEAESYFQVDTDRRRLFADCRDATAWLLADAAGAQQQEEQQQEKQRLEQELAWACAELCSRLGFSSYPSGMAYMLAPLTALAAPAPAASPPPMKA